MSDENIVDINRRRSRSASSSVWAMAEQLIAMEDIREVLQVLGDISHDVPEVQLLRDIPNTPEISERVHDIIYEAVGQLEQFEDSLKDRPG
jgi:hypothetical protein